MHSKKTQITALLLVLAVMLLVPIATTIFFKDGLYYPYLTVNTSATVDTTFLFNGRRSLSSCEKALDTISQSIFSVCSTCKPVQGQCLPSLEPMQRRILSSEPLDVPSSRLPNGVITYRSTDSNIALSACIEAERQSINSKNGRVTCFAPHLPRPFTVPSLPIDQSDFLVAVGFSIVSGAVCWLICLLLVRYQRFHGHLSYDATAGGPQKFHAVATPRVGGIAILIGLLFTGAGLVPVEQRFSVEEYGLLILAALPAFAGGFAEDITRRVGVLPRLACTMAAAALCAWLIAAVLRQLDLPLIDYFLTWTPLAVAFTIFAVGGVANSINIIDGYNGLVGGYSILVLAAIAWVAGLVGDMFILTAALSMVGALGGFLAWNYPKGRIFLGDGGAYFLGFWMAELSVLLVARHDEVSPWYPLALLAYPVFETLFSVYRRKIIRGRSPGQPDALHFHQLVYMRLARVGVGSKNPVERTRRNSMVAAYICPGTAIFILLAIACWRSTPALATLTVLFCVGYVWLYRRLVRLHAPAWLISTPERSVMWFGDR